MTITHATVAGTPAVAGKIAGPEWDAAHLGNGLNVYNVKDAAYGAVGDGVAHDTTAINAAITACNAAGGGTVYFPRGTYLALAVALKSNVRLVGDGAATLRKDAGSGAQAVIQADGSVGTGVNLSANVAQAAQSVAAASNPASLAAGDYVLIRDNTYAYGTGPEARNQEINRIASVSGSFTFNLVAPTIGSYATASTAQILKLTPIADATIENLAVQVPVGTDGGCIEATYATGLTVMDCRISGMNNWSGVQLNICSRVSVFHNEIRDAQMPDVNHGFAMAIDNSHHVQIFANHFENYMEIAFSNKARDCYFVNNVCKGPHDSGVNTHGSGNERILIADNIVTGSWQYGIAVGHSIAPATDRDIVIARNQIVDPASVAITVVAGSGPIPMTYVSVVDNQITGWNRGNGSSTYGILVSGADTNLLIQGNVLDGEGIDASGNGQTGILLASPSQVLVIGNTIRNIANGYGIQVDSTTNVTIQANQLTNISSFNIRSTTTNTGLVVRDNDTDDASVDGPLTNDVWFGNQFGAGVPVGQVRAFALASAHAISSTTATEVTGLGPCTLVPGTYTFQFMLLAQSATATVSPMFGINFTGTAAVRSFRLRYPGTGTTATTGVADDVGGVTGQIEESQAMNGFVTGTPNMGATGGVTATGTNILYIIEGLLVVTATGDLELWHGSETATSTTVSAGSSLTVTRTA